MRPVPDIQDLNQTQTHSGIKGQALRQEERLIFELDGWHKTGVDLPEVASDLGPDDLEGLLRQDPIGLPGLSEPETMRHYVRLSQANHAIDLALYPLGSCTMKHNPRLNEKIVRWPGFADVHPLQPFSTVQGVLSLIHQISHWLISLTGMEALAFSPKAGAHGELCGLLTIRAAHDARKDFKRDTVLVPKSAHGTNPATASLAGYKVENIEQNDNGLIDLEDLKRKISPSVAALMVTNPNTAGLFEKEIAAMADIIHEAGAFFYCDGANFNAIVGRVRPGDLGVDAMHINLHKTFSTPHGGGGPGAGPVVLSKALASYAPRPLLVKDQEGFRLLDTADPREGFEQHLGRICAFQGQIGMFVRAYAYMLSYGGEGLRQVSGDAVLNANYIKARLSPYLSLAFPESPCLHEVLFDDTWLEATGITSLDFAKALIDEGFHPMTIYFPLTVKGAMLIEPTETESLAELDRFCDAMIALVKAAKSGESERFKNAPVLTPRRRLDETLAARHPRLVWTEEA